MKRTEPVQSVNKSVAAFANKKRKKKRKSEKGI